MPRPLALLLLVLAMALSGANVPVAKSVLAELPPGPLLLLRFALASLLLAPLALHEPGPQVWRLSPVQWLSVAILGLVGSVLFTFFILAGVARTSAASAGIILSALPAAIGILGAMRGERLGLPGAAMIALAVAGVALIQTNATAAASPGSPGSPDDTLLGNLLIVMAVLCEAAFVIAARRIAAEIPALRLSFAVALVSLLACLPFCLPAVLALDSATIGSTTWLLLVWYTLSAGVIATILWYKAAPYVEAWLAGVATAAMPVGALAVSAMLLGETVGPAQSAGAMLVIAAILTGARRR